MTLSIEDPHMAHTPGRAELQTRFSAFKARGLAIDMTRGKPCAAQVALSDPMLDMPGVGGHTTAEGFDARNYYGSALGLLEARTLFATMLGAPPEQVAIANNSSLALMHDMVVYALLHGVLDGSQPWRAGPVKFLCPVPGYDRHFAICEAYGIEMVPVPMTGSGPDMAVVEALVRDPQVRGMWCVPMYSNPTGETYSPDVVERLARMKTGAPDFRLFWDNAYAVHHLTDTEHTLPNILERCSLAGHANRPLVFGSMSKITFAGGGLGLFASSPSNIRWYARHAGVRSIGPDKLNQLRHVRLLRDHAGLRAHMTKHRAIIAPKFALVEASLQRRIGGRGVATWSRPDGGYFVSLQVQDGCAARVVALARELGIALVPAGRTYPLGLDPRDSNLRLAPTFPELADIEAAMEGICLSILLASTEGRGA
ncbi:aminotransferase class I/II-fold pyridoxal phosphate-dependent enzyme [Variovorax arabinosiphilus]|uniref:aminotransferase class I/II-fold pyridoxal phosphate-dependent enzyme n=1 Tax=Variovorax arabinosiphilus TaxID=3053498 RepID=UPI0025777066|nr:MULTISPECIES: aminotransferase class I/II-fold pyridoxal phosphate-dependent enzyme [unclassified Variovorax]MDM0123054.1 aminotransferase class I/II-fold pyridoxal phosphate-dependent enzyme [Variovorax sp. J2L1-78]MDM0131950.1 aminotransferase class I/II-fold pyridoxal phosphate-dependent enzyme [Variovorax sp. J2L1-63]MDM0235817.1 aminotransferase class I/II-fold pyridoxal phosphate-dependent enzyme [Variovorax sp. J2R1-6]